MKNVSTLATLVFILTSASCAAKKVSSATKDVVNTHGTIRISAPQDVDSALEKKVLDATGRYLCFGVSSESKFIVWTSINKNGCTFDDTSGDAGSQIRYVKGVTLTQFRQSEPTDRPNVTAVRFMINTTQVGSGEFDNSIIGGFKLKELCNGEVANACDLVIQGDKIEIVLKKSY